ncbi:MAG: hypothetical protein JNL30_12265 [Rubrivivax sp.]|nr:hypothetical protein [Rubrivivax sp.]
MNKPPTEPRWYQPWRRAEARPADDPADLGTCFGLELSLSTQPSPAKAADASQRVGWVRRLTSRRSRAA